MLDSLKDKGVYLAILLRFERYTLPRAIAIKERVEQGHKLKDHEIEFLHKILTQMNQYKALIERHPEYHSLEARAIWLYTQIISLALQNEKKD